MSGIGTHRPRRLRHASGDRGTTLVELLIAVAVMGYVSASLLSMVATFLRNENGPTTRITETRDLLRVGSTLSDDVSSAAIDLLSADAVPADGVLDAVAPTTVRLCPGYTKAGRNVLALDWVEDFGGELERHRVQYWLETSATSPRLVRLECSGSPLSTARVTLAATRLASESPAVAVVDGETVTMTLTAASGRMHVLSATSQNAAAELEIAQEDE